MASSELCFLTARELAGRIRAKELSAREVLEAHLAQIERVNPRVNAIVTLVADQARVAAATADETLSRGQTPGPLHGLPIAHKDLVETKGIRTTFGSPIFAENVPDRDALIVQRIRAAGAITIGKTNTPEFGAGSQTFNPVFGATLNPWDTTKTCGGSSGGAAVAISAGMIPIADGSDTGGSLRNPANFNGVVGFRPSPGRVPAWPHRTLWSPLSVQGPMARTVGDAALLLSAIAGPDPHSALALETPGTRFAEPLDRDFRGTRVAWSRSLGGLPVDPRVTAAIDARRKTFADLGCVVDDVEPDFSGADEAFKTFRAWEMEIACGELVRTRPSEVKATVVWNVEEGMRLTGPVIGRAETLRSALFHRMRELFERYDYLVCPVNQVPPFDVNTEYPTEVAGVPMDTYIDWMKSCYYISIAGNPAISVPAGFTPEGLPVGLQIVGPFREDFAVLQIAHAYEQATNLWRQRPPAGL
jgi:amidase